MVLDANISFSLLVPADAIQISILDIGGNGVVGVDGSVTGASEVLDSDGLTAPSAPQPTFATVYSVEGDDTSNNNPHGNIVRNFDECENNEHVSSSESADSGSEVDMTDAKANVTARSHDSFWAELINSISPGLQGYVTQPTVYDVAWFNKRDCSLPGVTVDKSMSAWKLVILKVASGTNTALGTADVCAEVKKIGIEKPAYYIVMKFDDMQVAFRCSPDWNIFGVSRDGTPLGCDDHKVGEPCGCKLDDDHEKAWTEFEYHDSNEAALRKLCIQNHPIDLKFDDIRDDRGNRLLQFSLYYKDGEVIDGWAKCRPDGFESGETFSAGELLRTHKQNLDWSNTPA